MNHLKFLCLALNIKSRELSAERLPLRRLDLSTLKQAICLIGGDIQAIGKLLE